MKDHRDSSKKTIAAAVLYVLAFIFCMVLVRETAAISLGLPGPSLMRLLFFLPFAVALVAGLSYVSSTHSLLWQVPLQGAAVGLLLAALPVVVTGFLGNWAVFSTPLGLKAVAVALLGFAVAWLMRHLQRRHLYSQDA